MRDTVSSYKVKILRKEVSFFFILLFFNFLLNFIKVLCFKFYVFVFLLCFFLFSFYVFTFEFVKGAKVSSLNLAHDGLAIYG